MTAAPQPAGPTYVASLVNRMREYLRKLFREKKKRQATHRVRSASRAKDVEQAGRFYYIGDVLDQLDEYRGYIRKIRNYDADVYYLHARLGGVVAPAEGGVRAGDFRSEVAPPNWKQGGGPAFGMLAFLGWEDAVTVSDGLPKMRFFYFMKYQAIEGVQAHSGDLYLLTVVCAPNISSTLRRFGDLFLHAPIEVNESGHVRLLKQKVGKGRWDYPHWVKCFVSEDKLESRGWGETPQQWASRLFLWAVYFWESASSDLVVRAEKDGLCTAFCVDLLRTPYFFKDREKTKGATGRTNKIVHIVRTHVRRKGNKASFVRSHFRGERHFVWHGYRVTVSMPGFHHASIRDFTAPARISLKRHRGTIGIPGATRMFASEVSRPGNRRPDLPWR